MLRAQKRIVRYVDGEEQVISVGTDFKATDAKEEEMLRRTGAAVLKSEAEKAEKSAAQKAQAETEVKPDSKDEKSSKKSG